MDKWNKLCFYMSEKVGSEISEREYEKIVERGLEILGWSEYSGDFEIRPKFQLGSVKNKMIPDFVVKSNITNNKLFIIEIKSPKLDLNDIHKRQLLTYMRQFKLDFGLLIAKNIQIYYDGKLNNSDEPILLEKIEFIRDSENGKKFTELFSKDNFNFEQLNVFAHNSIKLLTDYEIENQVIKILKSENFKNEIINSISNILANNFDRSIIIKALEKISIEIKENRNEIDYSVNPKSFFNKNDYNVNIKNSKPISRDYSKYIINSNGIKLPKNRLVLELVKDYITKNPMNYNDLKKLFKDEYQGSTGVINRFDEVNQKYINSEDKRHFINSDEILISKDYIKFVVSTQWKITNIREILKLAKELGYKIETFES